MHNENTKDYSKKLKTEIYENASCICELEDYIIKISILSKVLLSLMLPVKLSSVFWNWESKSGPCTLQLNTVLLSCIPNPQIFS